MKRFLKIATAAACTIAALAILHAAGCDWDLLILVPLMALLVMLMESATQ